MATGKIDMVSVGGESYANARVCDFDWIKNIYSDDKFAAVKNNIDGILRPENFIGRAAEQVDDFLAECIASVRFRLD